ADRPAVDLVGLGQGRLRTVPEFLVERQFDPQCGQVAARLVWGFQTGDASVRDHSLLPLPHLPSTSIMVDWPRVVLEPWAGGLAFRASAGGKAACQVHRLPDRSGTASPRGTAWEAASRDLHARPPIRPRASKEIPSTRSKLDHSVNPG